MIVYLWDAHGADQSAAGISGDETRAREAAEACLRSAYATSARVEAALLATSARTLQPCYERTGTAWQARPVDGGFRWDPALPVEASLAHGRDRFTASRDGSAFA